MKKCKICNAETAVLIDKKTSKSYRKCATCKYIYLDEEFYVDAAQERKHYEKHHNTFDSKGYVEMFESLISEYVEPFGSEIDSILDFGCGRGEVLPELLSRRGFSCDRYDPYFFPDKTYLGKKYDMLISTEVFEHLQDPSAVLEELLGSLREGGYLLLMSSFHPDNDEEFLKWWYIRDITHIGFFALETFEHISKESSLEILGHNHKNIILFKKNTCGK